MLAVRHIGAQRSLRVHRWLTESTESTERRMLEPVPAVA
jgi:hypothetical protein